MKIPKIGFWTCCVMALHAVAAPPIDVQAVESFAKVEQDVVFGRSYLSDGRSIDRVMDVWTPKTPSDAKRSALVCLHGNPGQSSYPNGRQHGFQEYANYFVPKGYALFVPAWDLVDRGSGLFSQIQTAVRFVRANAERYGVDPDRIASIGHSYGGSWSIALAVVDDELEALNAKEQADPINHWGVSARVCASVAAPGGVFFPEQCDGDDAPILYAWGTEDKRHIENWNAANLLKYQRGNVAYAQFAIKNEPHGISLDAKAAFDRTFAEIVEAFLDVHVRKNAATDMAMIHLLRKGAGSIRIAPENRFVPIGTKVTLEARPDPGRRFTGWQGDLQGEQATTTMVIKKNTRITAVFQAAPKE
jgi:pimeloyl-ACP methyl ester carboxylesterase